MTRVTTAEARNGLGDLIARMRLMNEEFEITRRGKIVAYLVRPESRLKGTRRKAASDASA